jgi:hypothetical protein
MPELKKILSFRPEMYIMKTTNKELSFLKVSARQNRKLKLHIDGDP